MHTNSSPIRSLKPLLAGIVDVDEGDDCNIDRLVADSRVTVPGSLFCAYPGLTMDGRDFIGNAIEKGARAVLYESTGACYGEDYAVPAYAVDDLQQQLGKVADRFYGSPSQQLVVIGITGTNGKTTCAHLIAQALKALNKTSGMIGTLGSGLVDSVVPGSLTTPDAVQVHELLADLLRQDAQTVAMEVSSHALDQGRVNGIAFDIAVFTNLTRDHLDYHGTMHSYGAAKAGLFALPSIRHAIINTDDDFGRELLQKIPRDKVLSYGEINADVQLLKAKVESDGLVLHIVTPRGELEFHAKSLDRINIPNLLAVTATLIVLDYSPEEVAVAMADLSPVPGRMELFRSAAGAPDVVVDYSHTPDALRQTLLSLRERTQGKLWCVFGCGGDRDRGKRAQMGAAAEKYADHVVLTDDNPRSEDGDQIIQDILSGMQSTPRQQTRDRRQAIAYAINSAQCNDLVLIAGKGHETTQTIGDQVNEFSDRTVVRTCLKDMTREVVH